MATKTSFIMEWRVHIWSVSRIETYKVLDVPRIGDIDSVQAAKLVRPWSGNLFDHVRPFPRGGELVHFFGFWLSTENEVADRK